MSTPLYELCITDPPYQQKINNSLNECIYKGRTIIRFTRSVFKISYKPCNLHLRYGIVKAFLQIPINVEDRDCIRFLWIKELHKPIDDSNLRMFQFYRVAFGIIAGPFLLAATLQHLLKKYSENEYANQSARGIYVDIINSGVNDTESAITFYNDAAKIFNNCSMNLNLRQWNTNDPEFRKYIPKHHADNDPVIGVLGIHWNTNNKLLLKPFTSQNQDQPTTVRNILKAFGEDLRPIWLVLSSNNHVRSKILIQELKEEKYNWDDNLPAKYLRKLLELIV